MNRTRNALVAAAFAYVNFGVALVSGIVLVPLILRSLGTRPYSLWLTTGELLVYAGMLDFGVLTMLPWMVAQADGRDDVAEIRCILSRALAITVGAGMLLAAVVLAAWTIVPSALALGKADFEVVAGPLLVVVAAMVATYPAKIFHAALVGLQDVRFTGCLAVCQTALSVGLTVWLLAAGYGLYAIATAAALPPAAAAVASLFRLRVIKPAAVRGWPAPDIASLRAMVVDGAGAWIGGVGWTMVAATSGIVITSLGHPETVVVYACTAKLSQLLFHLSRVLPDSALVGLAQIDGGGHTDRLRLVVTRMLRVHLVLSGAAAIAALCFNPLFVRLWVGSAYFGGNALNVALVGALVSISLAHGLVSCAAVLGYRRQVGVVTLAYGILTVTFAVVLGRVFGLAGVAIAPIFSGAMTTLPAGALLLRRLSILSLRWLMRDLWGPWAWRFAALLIVIGVAGTASDWTTSEYVFRALLGVVAVTVYMLSMRSLWRDLPLGSKLSDVLSRLKLTRSAMPGSVGEAKTWG